MILRITVFVILIKKKNSYKNEESRVEIFSHLDKLDGFETSLNHIPQFKYITNFSNLYPNLFSLDVIQSIKTTSRRHRDTLIKLTIIEHRKNSIYDTTTTCQLKQQN